MRAHIVLIQRDSRNSVARYAGRDGVNAVRCPCLHLRNHRRTRPLSTHQTLAAVQRLILSPIKLIEVANDDVAFLRSVRKYQIPV